MSAFLYYIFDESYINYIIYFCTPKNKFKQRATTYAG